VTHGERTKLRWAARPSDGPSKFEFIWYLTLLARRARHSRGDLIRGERGSPANELRNACKGGVFVVGDFNPITWENGSSDGPTDWTRLLAVRVYGPHPVHILVWNLSVGGDFEESILGETVEAK
jgi:hypothetical protein